MNSPSVIIARVRYVILSQYATELKYCKTVTIFFSKQINGFSWYKRGNVLNEPLVLILLNTIINHNNYCSKKWVLLLSPRWRCVSRLSQENESSTQICRLNVLRVCLLVAIYIWHFLKDTVYDTNLCALDELKAIFIVLQKLFTVTFFISYFSTRLLERGQCISVQNAQFQQPIKK